MLNCRRVRVSTFRPAMPNTRDVLGLALRPTGLEVGAFAVIHDEAACRLMAALNALVAFLRHFLALLLALVKRRRNHLGGETFSSDVNSKFLTLICKFRGHKSQTDVLLEKGGGRPRSDGADLFVPDVNVEAVAGDPGLPHLEPDQLALEALLLHFGDLVAPNEIALL